MGAIKENITGQMTDNEAQAFYREFARQSRQNQPKMPDYADRNVAEQE